MKQYTTPEQTAKLLEVGICLVLAIPVTIVWALIRSRKMDKDNNNPI